LISGCHRAGPQFAEIIERHRQLPEIIEPARVA